MAEGRLDPGGTAASARGEPADAVRAQILRAAQARFARYGFNKTTMAEIAADCGMSAANIYRYFDGKGDIAAVGTGRWLAALETELEGLADDAARAPAERLRRLVLAKLEAMAALIRSAPHLDELIDHVCSAREEVVASHRLAVRALYARVIRAGQRAGAFAAGDADWAAAAFDAATCGFFHHSLLRAQAADKVRAEAEAALALLIAGLSAGPYGEAAGDG